MADFGKLNFSVSFNPTSAFPVDARYHFTTLAAAEAAAQGAVEVGSSEGTYFFGETVVVQTNTDATLYVIQPDKTLKALGSSSDLSTLRSEVEAAQAAAEAAQKDATQALGDAATAKAAADAKVASVSVGNGITKTGTDTAPVLDVKVDTVEGNLIQKTEAGLKVIVPEQTDYTVTVETPTGTEYSASYIFKQLGNTLATINIPKDMVVSSGEVVTYTEETKPAEVATAGTYIVLTIANKASDKLYINVSDLLDDKTIEGVSGTDITVTADSSEGPVKITATINEGAVKTTHIADSAVTTDKINSKAVTTAKIADSAVDTLQIKDNAVTTGKVLDSAITTAKIADEAVTISKIATSAKTTIINKAAASDDTIPTTKAVTDYIDTQAEAKADKSYVDTELAKKANVATTLSGYGITDAYTKSEVDAKVSSVYKYKGTVATVSDLPASDLTVGDVYNVEAAGTIGSGESVVKVNAGDNVVWTGTAWDVLAGTVDLSNYYNKEEVDNKFDLNHINFETNYDKSGTGAVSQQFDSGDTLNFTGKNNYFTQEDLTSTFGADAQITAIPKGGIGDFASSFGGKSTAKGKRSMAQGTTTIAAGPYSHAEGDNSVALGADSHAEGYMNLARGGASHAEGGGTHAQGNHSHTEGGLTKTIAGADYGHAEGLSTEVSGKYAHSEGSSTKAQGIASHSEGQETVASGNVSHSEGYKTNATGNHAHSEGSNTIASADSAHSEGEGTEATSIRSHAEGSATKTGALVDLSIPDPDEPSSPSEGGGTGEGGGTSTPTVTTGASHSEGYRTSAYGWGSHSEGGSTIAYNHYSHAEGQRTKAYGEGSHAEGLATIAGNEADLTKGKNAHAEGYATKATGNHAHAEGYGTEATGAGSHSEGGNTTASGEYAHSEGQGTEASGYASKAFGQETKATATRSVAGGYFAEANGDTSFSFGIGTLATNENEVAFGKYNKSNANTLFSIGIGATKNSRRNAFEVTTDGKVTIPSLENHYTKTELDVKFAEIDAGLSITPTLDEVLTAGNSTTKDISVGNINVGQDISMSSTSLLTIGDPSDSTLQLSSTSIYLGENGISSLNISVENSAASVSGSEAMRTAFVNWLNTGTIYRYSA